MGQPPMMLNSFWLRNNQDSVSSRFELTAVASGLSSSRKLSDGWRNIPWLLKNSFSPKSTKIKSRQEALQSIFSGRLDIFCLPNFGCWALKASFSTATPVYTQNPVHRVNERNRLWVLKNSVIGTCFLAGSVAADKFSFLTSAKR